MNVYYELPQAVADFYDECDGHRYYVAIGVRKSAAVAGEYRRWMANADRAWAEEDDGTVRFLKHRLYEADQTKVDLKEFMWVKLSAVKV